MKKRGSLEARRRFWGHHLREWQSSGLSQAEYCRRNKLSVKSLGYWKRRLKVSSGPIRLVEVPMHRESPVPVAVSPSSLRLLVGSQYRIEVEKGFDAEALDELIRFLDKR